MVELLVDKYGVDPRTVSEVSIMAYISQDKKWNETQGDLTGNLTENLAFQVQGHVG